MKLLYGQNTFRFTGPNGWAIFIMFFQQIGWRGRKALKQVEVCAPEFGPVFGYGRVDHGRYFRENTIRAKNDICDEVGIFGFKYDSRAFEEGLLRYSSKKRLEKPIVARCTGLKSLSIIVPSWWDEEEMLKWNEKCFDMLQSKLPELKISMVRLRKSEGQLESQWRDGRLFENENDDPETIQEEWTTERPKESSAQAKLFELARKKGWAFKDAMLAADGTYDVQMVPTLC